MEHKNTYKRHGIDPNWIDEQKMETEEDFAYHDLDWQDDETGYYEGCDDIPVCMCRCEMGLALAFHVELEVPWRLGTWQVIGTRMVIDLESDGRDANKSTDLLKFEDLLSFLPHCAETWINQQDRRTNFGDGQIPELLNEDMWYAASSVTPGMFMHSSAAAGITSSSRSSTSAASDTLSRASNSSTLTASFSVTSGHGAAPAMAAAHAHAVHLGSSSNLIARQRCKYK